MSYLSSEICKEAFAQLATQRVSGKFIGVLFVLKNMSYQTILNTTLGNLNYAAYDESAVKNDLKSYFSLVSRNEPSIDREERGYFIFVNDLKNNMLRDVLKGQRIPAIYFATIIFKNTFFEQPVTKRDLEVRLRNLLNISDDWYQNWFIEANSEEVLNMEDAPFRWENFEYNGTSYTFRQDHESIIFTANSGCPYTTDAAPDELTRGPFFQPIYASHKNPIQFIPQEFFFQNSEDLSSCYDQIFNHSQIIYFGAPGTGKSHKIDYGLLKDENGNSFGLKMVGKEFKFRTTFHPDYDYAQFVGAYKPKSIPMNQQNGNGQNNHGREERKITYEFAPQVFAKAYVKAWTEFLKPRTPETPMQNVYLVIEEINRGNCAQIFGDIFQLLDRKDGHSAYFIDVDADFADYIRGQLSSVKLDNENVANYWERYKMQIQTWSSENGLDDNEICNDFCKIALPPNLIILATMNTSDQSLFPMDSAFKRRFDWEYVPINDKHPEAHFAIEVGNIQYDWRDFLKKVNKNIYDVTKSEDKQLGEFFIKPKNGNSIKFDEFRSKVLFYLWDSIYKDEEGNEKAETVFHFKIAEGSDDTMTFQKLFDKENGVSHVKMILERLDIKEYNQNEDVPANNAEQDLNQGDDEMDVLEENADEHAEG